MSLRSVKTYRVVGPWLASRLLGPCPGRYPFAASSRAPFRSLNASVAETVLGDVRRRCFDHRGLGDATLAPSRVRRTDIGRSHELADGERREPRAGFAAKID